MKKDISLILNENNKNLNSLSAYFKEELANKIDKSFLNQFISNYFFLI